MQDIHALTEGRRAKKPTFFVNICASANLNKFYLHISLLLSFVGVSFYQPFPYSSHSPSTISISQCSHLWIQLVLQRDNIN